MKAFSEKNILSGFLIVLISLSLVIISGVNGCGGTTTATNTVGLEISFVKDAPPISVVSGREFRIEAEILNKGGEWVNKGQAKFYLSGLGQNFENVQSTLTNEKTLQKEAVFPDSLVFAEKAKYTSPLQAIFVVPLVLTTCYDYSGKAQATICISGSNESKICKISGEKVTSNTAGPVQISSVTESLIRNKLVVIFEIANKGTGEVYLSDTNCDNLEANDFVESNKQKKLNVTITTRDNFVCKMQSSTGQTEGLEGIAPVGKVICEKEITNEDYQSVFTIDLLYKYRDSISQSVNILPA
jgi:hypothetical protein